MKRTGLPKRNCVLIGIFFSLTVAFLTSCSLFQWDTPTGPRVAKLPPPPPEPPKEQVPYTEVNLDCPLSLVSNPKIYVYKSDRRLLLVNNGVLVREYPIGLGFSPNGDKFMRGDGRTPEGQFFICAKNPNSRFYKSLGLNYPDPRHAEKALVWGAISLEDFRNIVEASEGKRRPPSNTVLGGDIFIHGGGAGRDWTWGCVAVRNSAMDELFSIVSVGTPVEVMP